MAFRDLVFAARALWNNPSWVLIVVLTFSLGIGGAIALFSVTNAVLLRPLPYHDPDRLVVGYADFKKRSLSGAAFSTANYLDLRSATSDVFEAFAGVYTGEQTLPGADGSMEAIRYGLASPNIFKILGARMILGRDFVEADGQPQGSIPPGIKPAEQGTPALPVMAILSYDYWQRRYGGSRDILGADIRGSGRSGQQIIGVLAPGFQLLFPASDVMLPNPDVWVVNRMSYRESELYGNWLRLIGRLKPGITIERARAEVESASNHMRSRNAKLESGGFFTRLEPMQANLVRKVRSGIVVLMGGALLLLLIACANVSSLMLAQATARQREMAVQSALGASSGHLIWRLFLEALMVAALGSVLGIALAWAGIQELRWISPQNIPRLDSVRIDPLVLSFAVLSTFACAVICVLAPALAVRKVELISVLRGIGRAGALGPGQVLRNVVVASEVALGFVLLIALGLMVRSFIELQKVDPGFDPHRLLTFQLLAELGPLPQRLSFQDRLHERLEALPGVESVTVSGPLPLSRGGRGQFRWGFDEMRTDPSQGHPAFVQTVGPGYFETFRTRIVQGRSFRRGEDPNRSIIIDQAIAARYFPERSPIRQQILLAAGSTTPLRMEIVGVAGTQRVLSLAEPGSGQLFLADGFADYTGEHWAIRTAADPVNLAKAVRSEVAKLDRQIAVLRMEPMDQIVERAQANTRFALFLIGVFAVVAVLLVTVGLYGVLSTVVRQRTAEIGVRMALGAEPSTVQRYIVGQGLRLSAIGVAVGLVLALVLTRLMTSLLVEVKPFDPLTFLTIAVIFFGLAALSSWIPARRAAALDPATALRTE